MDTDQHRALTEEAIQWFVALRDGAVRPSDRLQFEQWRRKSPAHEKAWASVCETWDEVGKAAPVLATQIAAASKIASARNTWRNWVPVVAAACMVIAVSGLVISNPQWLADRQTGAGEQADVQLPDGSIAEMDSATALSYRVQDGERVVTLYSGQAHFRVASREGEPFVVEVRRGRIRALGTAFDVKMLPNSVSVAVTEHAVDVTHPGSGRVQLRKGQQVRYSEAGIGPVQRADMPAVLSWQQRRLVFEDTPLGEVLADLDRYRPGRLLVMDDAVRSLRVTAVLDVSDPEAALETIEKALPVKVLRVGQLISLISKKS